MRKLIVSGLFWMASTALSAKPACNAIDVERAQNFYDLLVQNGSYGYGYALKEAEIALLDTKHCAEVIDTSEYCLKKNTLLEIIIGRFERVRQGIVEIKDVSDYMKQIVDLRRLCKE